MTSPVRKRKCENWLKSLQQYVEDTESPRQFWLWSGISTIAGALQRKVWLPFGLKSDTIYPCLYVMIVAPPGECRKAAPVTFSKDLLTEVKAGVFIDSPTKRKLTKFLDELGRRQLFYYLDSQGRKLPKAHCSVSLISKELSSFLAVDAKAMIELLTELYDPHERWEYGTSGEGDDVLRGVCTNCFFATTPTWLAANLPDEAIGGGFTSRFIIVSGTEKYKWVCPIGLAPDEQLRKDLVTDLIRIKTLTGEFQWSASGEAFYREWYRSTEKLLRENRNPKMRSFLSRMPTIAIKVAMCLHVAYSDELIIRAQDIRAASELVTDVYKTAGEALGGQGISRTSASVSKIMRQIRMFSRDGYVPFSELLRMNYFDTNKAELQEVMETIEAMGVIKVRHNPQGKPEYLWQGYPDSKGSGGKPRKQKSPPTSANGDSA